MIRMISFITRVMDQSYRSDSTQYLDNLGFKNIENDLLDSAKSSRSRKGL